MQSPRTRNRTNTKLQKPGSAGVVLRPPVVSLILQEPCPYIGITIARNSHGPEGIHSPGSQPWKDSAANYVFGRFGRSSARLIREPRIIESDWLFHTCFRRLRVCVYIYIHTNLYLYLSYIIMYHLMLYSKTVLYYNTCICIYYTCIQTYTMHACMHACSMCVCVCMYVCKCMHVST